MTTYTMTKRFNGEVVETNVATYMDAIRLINDKYNNCGYDVIIHPSAETMREYQQRQINETYDYTQGGWAFV